MQRRTIAWAMAWSSSDDVKATAMHRDDSRGLPTAASDALDALWTELLASRTATVSRTRLREAARRVSDGAHDAQLRPEQLIIAIKDSWSARQLSVFEMKQRRLIESVVTDMISICIREFYERTSGDHDDRPRA